MEGRGYGWRTTVVRPEMSRAKASCTNASLPHTHTHTHTHTATHTSDRPDRSDRLMITQQGITPQGVCMYAPLGVQRGRGLVQYEETRVFQQRAGDGDTLLLPAGQLYLERRGYAVKQRQWAEWRDRHHHLASTVADDGIVTVR